MAQSHKPAAASLLAICLVATACSDPKAPSKANFRKVLEPVVADAFCRTIPAPRMAEEGRTGEAAFPLTVATGEKPGSYFDPSFDRASVQMLDAAAHGGLLTKKENEFVVKERGASGAAVRRRTATYAPTAAGAPYFRAVGARTASGVLPFPAMCLAKGEIVEIVRWTEPADMLGHRISQVTYTYRGVDPMPLGTAEERAALTKPIERTIPMMLASDGWRTMTR